VLYGTASLLRSKYGRTRGDRRGELGPVVDTTRGGIFGTQPEKSHEPKSELRLRKTPSCNTRSRALASSLQPKGNGTYVFRAFVLSIALIVALAPNASLLCIVSCPPRPAAASTVPHHGEHSAVTSASHHGEHSAVTSASHHGEPAALTSAWHHGEPAGASGLVWDDACPYCGSLGALQFLRENVRSSVSALDAVHAILVPRYQFAPATTDTRPGQEPWRGWWLEQQPQLTALRI